MIRIQFLATVLILALLAGCGNEQATAGPGKGGNHPNEATSVAQQREVTLAVPDMSCAMCPITVRKALARIDGVTQAKASLEYKQARVVFEPARTDIDALIAAVADAGFTATPEGQAGE